MSLELAVVAIIVIDSLHLQIVAIEQVFELLVFFSIEDLLYFFHSPFQLIVTIAYNDNMKGLIVFKNILLGFICSSPSYCNLAP